MVFEVEHRVEAGEDLLLASLASRLPSGEGAPGAIVELLVTDRDEATVSRAVRELDFSAFPELYDGVCVTEDADLDIRCSLNMIHTARWMPGADLLVASDTSNSRILWIRPDWGTRVGVVESVLEVGHPDWQKYRYPNGIHLWEEDGRVLMLSTFKSANAADVARANTGRVVLWDVSDPYAPVGLWAFPERGYLAAVHNAIVAEVGGVRHLLYAHSLGQASDWMAETGGSVGVALYNGLDVAPTYLGDGILPSSEDAFGFLREVEPMPDGERLLVLDSGCQAGGDCGTPPGAAYVRLPSLSPSGLGGAFSPEHEDQHWFTVELEDLRTHKALHAPYEADAIPRAALGKGLSGG